MGNPSKNIYVLMMSLILLMGCLGGTTSSGDEGDTEDSDMTVINNYYNNSTPNLPPVIEANADELGASYDNTGFLESIEVYAFHAMTDWDGSITNAGWDWNLDGIIDVVVTDASAFYSFSIPASATFSEQNHVYANIVFGAVDDDGAWTSSPITRVGGFDDLTAGSGTYDARDASNNTSISGDTDDILIRISWDQNTAGLNWALVMIQLEVNNNTYDCSVQSGQECSITQDGSDSAVWETDEYIWLSESGTEICGAAGVSCTVNIYITYDGYTVVGTQTVTLS